MKEKVYNTSNFLYPVSRTWGSGIHKLFSSRKKGYMKLKLQNDKQMTSQDIFLHGYEKQDQSEQEIYDAPAHVNTQLKLPFFSTCKVFLPVLLKQSISLTRNYLSMLFQFALCVNSITIHTCSLCPFVNRFALKCKNLSLIPRAHKLVFHFQRYILSHMCRNTSMDK